MLSAESQDEAVLLESLWREKYRILEDKKALILEEIMNYPTPIPACDTQFNFLLEERTRISQELRRMRELSATRKGKDMEGMNL